MLPPPQPPQEATDIFSISDQVLADRLQFIEEIGFGNWGSVWLCRPKPSSSSQDPVRENKIAVKLVHRSKTSTTAARVRSLWNEMKVVRSLKHEPHPSIIPFYSFIITPSYALITMAYHPRLITVEVSEPHAKEWFRSLLSGVEFLHKRGVVHNDIKPANILLSNENVPVLVDFGFAERYDLDKPDAFHSNLSYGTPEYLSPERARGLPHDTRKSDVWSLGVTFFEILVGRTPFEAADGAETFATKDDLERYWARTLRGKWVGSWAMSRGAEKLLRRMVLPNADLRCTAEEAMRDAYWTSNEGEKEPAAKAHHRKSASVSHSRTSSLILDREMSKLLDVIPPWSSRANKDKERAAKAEKEREKEKERIAAKENKHKENKDKENKDKQPKDRERVKFATLAGKENAPRPPAAGKVFAADKEKDAAETTRGHARSYSQPKLQVLDGASAPASRGVNQTRRQTGVVPSVFAAFSPLKHDPPAPPPTPSLFVSPFGEAGENRPAKAAVAASSKPAARTTRRPLGPRGPSSPNASKENICRESPASAQQHEKRRSSQILRDVTSARKHDENVSRAGGGVRRAESKTLKSERSAREVRGAGADASVESKAPSVSGADTSKDSVRSRMKEWERERERLREMERLRMREVEETETETENESERESEQGRDPAGVREVERKSEQDRKREVSPQPEREREREREYFLPKISVGPPLSPTASVHPTTPLSPLFEEPSQPVESPTDALPDDSAHETGFSALKQSFRLSLGGAVRLYKSSTQLLGRSTPALTLGSDNVDEEESRMSLSPRASWEDEVLPPKTEEQLAEEKKMDRMTLWIQSVEKVVDEARQNFAASTTSGPLPPLPVAPISRRSSSCNRSARANRVPRKILPANQIFVNEYESGVFDRSVLSASTSSPASPLPSPSFLNTMNFADHSLPTIPSEMPSRVEHGSERDRSRSCAVEHDGASRVGGAAALAVPETPSRRRRATVVTRSPEMKRRPPSLEIDVSPSKRREKSKSHSELVRPITPITKLEFELERLAQPTPTPRLSTVVDKSLFIATSPAHKVPEEPEVSMRSTPPRQKDDLTASPLHVEPYPARPTRTTVALDTPAKRHLEGVYDRFLMSTTGVRRNGKGYQSDNGGPVGHVAAPRPHSSMAKRSQKFKFHTARRPMPPPVSSDDLRRASSVDEFGTFCPSQSTPAPAPAAGAEHNKNTIAVVRKAFKAIVTGKPTARSAKPIWV